MQTLTPKLLVTTLELGGGGGKEGRGMKALMNQIWSQHCSCELPPRNFKKALGKKHFEETGRFF